MFPILEVTFCLYMDVHLCRRTTKLEDVETHVKGRVLGGQPRHCICANASRGLSATADMPLQSDMISADICRA